MSDPEESIWTQKVRRTYLDDAEDLANEPSGGHVKMWLTGAVLATVPIAYGICCLVRGHTTLFGRRGPNADLSGAPGIALAIAYIAFGAFLHFHYFWGLSERLWRFSQAGKVLALTVFLPSLLYALYHAFVDVAI